MRRAKTVVPCVGLLLLASVTTACSLYFETDPPDTPRDAAPWPPPPPPPWPPFDAAPWPLFDAAPPPPPPEGMSATITIPPALRGQELYLDVAWQYLDRESRHQLLAVPSDARTMTLEDTLATALATALYTAELRLVDAMTFSARCPGSWRPEPSEVFEVPGEFDTIQEAIDWAPAGTIVYVHPGTYTEHLRLRSGVHLIGAGAEQTILDGQNLGETLIDFSGAAGVVVRGFTLRNAGTSWGDQECGAGDEGFTCQPYVVQKSVFGASDFPDEELGACDTSIVLMHNIIEANPVGVVLHRHAQATIRNNLFLGNSTSIMVSDLADHSLILGNTFDGDTRRSVVSGDRLLDVIGNIFTRTFLAVSHYVEGRAVELDCNVAFDVNISGWAGLDNEDAGNPYVDPGFLDPDGRDYRLSDGSSADVMQCYDTLDAGGPTFERAPGAYGGPAGDWYGQTITLEELEGMFVGIPLP